jgi:hypothetical protein
MVLATVLLGYAIKDIRRNQSQHPERILQLRVWQSADDVETLAARPP